MRSTKAFVLGLGAALFVERALSRRRRRGDQTAAVDDATIEHRVLGDALPAAGIDPDDVDVEVTDGVVSLQGSVEGTERADVLVQKVAQVPGVRDVAAMIRIPGDSKAA
jgi:osmotically-inducible protein OsmY